jgi:hypothetical protein
MAVISSSPEGPIYEARRPFKLGLGGGPLVRFRDDSEEPDGSPYWGPLRNAPRRVGLGRIPELVEEVRVPINSPEAEHYGAASPDELLPGWGPELPAWCPKCRRERWLNVEEMRQTLRVAGGREILI